MRLRLDGLGVDLGGRRIIDNVDLDVAPGEFVGLVGPNGSGKSTLLRCIYRVLRPRAGLVTIDTDDVWRLSARDVARLAAVVVQEPPLEFDFVVREMVSVGRLPHKGMLERDSSSDAAIIDQALAQVGMADSAEQSFTRLSGGEKQRVLIARALAQESHVLLLDEPTNHLDVRYQLEILDLVRRLGITTLAALHDLNLAAAYCDRVFVLSHGTVVAGGPPHDVLSPELVHQVFGVRAQRWTHPLTGRPQLAFASNESTGDSISVGRQATPSEQPATTRS